VGESDRKRQCRRRLEETDQSVTVKERYIAASWTVAKTDTASSGTVMDRDLARCVRLNRYIEIKDIARCGTVSV
jgi:hypothetical protein